jgi:hypothetical protein
MHKDGSAHAAAEANLEIVSIHNHQRAAHANGINQLKFILGILDLNGCKSPGILY